MLFEATDFKKKTNGNCSLKKKQRYIVSVPYHCTNNAYPHYSLAPKSQILYIYFFFPVFDKLRGGYSNFRLLLYTFKRLSLATSLVESMVKYL